MTYDLIVTPEMYRLASRSNKIIIASFDEKFGVPTEFDVRTQSNFKDRQAVSSTIEGTSGQIKNHTLETLMHFVNLTYNYRTEEVFNRDRKKLPYPLMEVCCKITTRDAFVNTWDTPENCVMAKILSENAKMLHYLLTTDQKENHFFFRSKFNDTGKRRT